MTESRPDCPYLAECVDAYRAAIVRADALQSALSERQITWKPDDRTWSVVECVEHLNITVGKQLEKMRVGALEARARGLSGGSAPYGKGTWFGRFLLNSMDPARDKKLRTFKSFDPSHSTLDVARVFEDFGKTNHELVRLALEVDGLQLGKIKVGSAPTNLLKMSLAQAFRVHVVHHARHLDQAGRLREHPGFP